MEKRLKNIVPVLLLVFNLLLPQLVTAETPIEADIYQSKVEAVDAEAINDSAEPTVPDEVEAEQGTKKVTDEKTGEEENEKLDEPTTADDEMSSEDTEKEVDPEVVEDVNDDETVGETEEDSELVEEIVEPLVPELDDREGIELENPVEERQVRVVIELDGSTLIEEATRQGVSVYDLGDAAIQSITSQLLKDQDNLKNVLKLNGIELSTYSKDDELTADDQFTVTVNAFVTYVKESDIESIRQTPGVSGVYEAIEYERPQFTVDMHTSNDMINQQIALELGYKGEGQVIAVIDSGTDPSHPDLQNLTDASRAALTSDMIAQLGLPGVYVNEKVPYAYNYYDLNNNYIDIGESGHHGQHVAGTVGANGFIKGVAPESQILGMKVFSDDIQYATTFSDVYLRAIEDAILLGADVINMSLGSPAGFYIPGSIEDLAINKAVANGIIVAISGGNENHIMNGAEVFGNYLLYGLTYPYAKNPDVGLVGSPSLNEGSISVGSVENTHVQADKIEFEVDGEKGAAAMQVASGSPDPALTLPGPQEIIHVGANSATPGVAADWEGIDVRGKVALVRRGNTFTDTLANAEAAGAIGLIVYNHADGGEALISMAGGDTAKIPFVFIGEIAGNAIVNALNATITFTDEQISTENPSAWRMSDFSSWGTTPDLRMKPEITAPGGQIYSTQNDGEYGTMSGTSMAAPHVAGGAALVQQRLKLDEIFTKLDLTDKERAELTKVLLMNTADILFDEYGEPYFVRRQGAGLMDLAGALTTDVVVVESESKNAKVELGSIKNKNFSFELDFLNFSDEVRYYSVDHLFMKDTIVNAGVGLDFSLLSSTGLIGTLNGQRVLQIDPNSKNNPARFLFNFDFSEDSIAWNQFVEGYLMFNPLSLNENGELVVTDKLTGLQIPVLGFYGNWDEPRVTDELRENANDPDASKHPTFTFTTPVKYDDGTLYFAEAKGDNYMNPDSNYALDASSSNFGFMATMLRNTEQINFRITDENGKVLRNLETYHNQRKITRMNRGTMPYTFFSNALWDGMIDGRPLYDNEIVYYEVEFLRTLNSTPQTFRFKIIGDNTAPTIEGLQIIERDGRVYLDFSSVENGSGGLTFEVQQLIGDATLGGFEFSGERSDFLIDVTSLLNQDADTTLVLMGQDNIGNAIVQEITIPAFKDETVVVATPIVDNVQAHHQNVSGSVEAENNVIVTLEDGTVLGSAIADENGLFIVEIDPQSAGTTLNIIADNNRGYVSEATVVVVDESPASIGVSIIADINGWPLSIAPEDMQFDFENMEVVAVSEDGKHQVVAINSRDYVKYFENLYLGNYLVTALNIPDGLQLLEPLYLSITKDLLQAPQTLDFKTIEEDIREPDENTQAQIVLDNPGLLTAYDTKETRVSGLVYGMNDISSFYAGDQEILLTPVDNYSVIINDVEVFYGRVYTFDEYITVEDGYHEMPFLVTNGDEEFSIVRRFWVDTIDPVFEDVSVRIRRLNDNQARIDLTLSDNLSVLHITRNGNYLADWDNTDQGFGSTDIEATLTDLVNLVEGKNVLTYTLTDFAGNVTTYEVIVHYVGADTPVSGLYEPTAGEIVIDLNETSELPEAVSVITNVEELPEGTTYAYANAEDLDLSGEMNDQQVVTVVVTYADGTEDRVDVPVTVIPLTLANQFEPKFGEIVIDLNESATLPPAEEVISNKADLPEGTTFAYENAEDLDLSGETVDAQTATVLVTYADGTEDHVDVSVTVIPTEPEAPAEPEAPVETEVPTEQDEEVVAEDVEEPKRGGLNLVPKVSAASETNTAASSDLPATGEKNSNVAYLGFILLVSGSILFIKDKRRRA